VKVTPAMERMAGRRFSLRSISQYHAPLTSAFDSTNMSSVFPSVDMPTEMVTDFENVEQLGPCKSRKHHVVAASDGPMGWVMGNLGFTVHTSKRFSLRKYAAYYIEIRITYLD